MFTVHNKTTLSNIVISPLASKSLQNCSWPNSLLNPDPLKKAHLCKKSENYSPHANTTYCPAATAQEIEFSRICLDDTPCSIWIEREDAKQKLEFIGWRVSILCSGGSLCVWRPCGERKRVKMFFFPDKDNWICSSLLFPPSSTHHSCGNPLQFLFMLSMVCMSSSLNSKSNSWKRKNSHATQSPGQSTAAAALFCVLHKWNPSPTHTKNGVQIEE